MKRSEAEKIIEEALNANHFDDNNEKATIILDELLQAGMLPPFVPMNWREGGLNLEEPVKQYNGLFHLAGHLKWEDESEENS